MISIALVPFLWLASKPIVVLLFQYGKFGASDSATVSRVFAMYALQVPFYTVGLLCSRTLSALKSNHLLLWISSLNVIVNVALNWLFMRTLGAAGIALSTSCVYLVSCLALWLAVERRIARLSGG